VRRGLVYYKDWFAGVITETDEGEYLFKYDEKYIVEHAQAPITFSMPVCHKTYTENRFFPFFEGLIPEGWLLDIASKNWKINKNDRMGLLLACCHNCIGAVSVLPMAVNDGE